MIWPFTKKRGKEKIFFFSSICAYWFWHPDRCLMRNRAEGELRGPQGEAQSESTHRHMHRKYTYRYEHIHTFFHAWCEWTEMTIYSIHRHRENDKIDVTDTHLLLPSLSDWSSLKFFFQLWTRIQDSIPHGYINLVNGNSSLLSLLGQKD